MCHEKKLVEEEAEETGGNAEETGGNMEEERERRGKGMNFIT